MSHVTNLTHPLDEATPDAMCRCGCPAQAHGDGVVLDDGSQPFAACFECPCEEFVPCCPCGVGEPHDAQDHATLPLAGVLP